MPPRSGVTCTVPAMQGGKEERRSVGWRVLAAVALTGALLGTAGGPSSGAPSRATPLPATSAFVEAASWDLLGRAPTTTELARWTERIAAGGARRSVTAEMVRRPEHTDRVVRRIFLTALLREPDAAGLSYWSGRLRDGLPTGSVASRIYASPELWAAGGGTPRGFVEQSYLRILGRPGDDAGVTWWADQVAAGMPRIELTRQLFGSPESGRLRVAGWYVSLLGHQPAPADATYWAGRLRTIDDIEVEATLVASTEYHGRAQDPAALATHDVTPIGTTDAGGARVSGDGRLVAFLAGSPSTGGLDVQLFDLATLRPRRLARTLGLAHSLDISADGRTVAVAVASEVLVPGPQTDTIDVYTIDVASGDVTRITAGDDLSYAPSLSADGRVLAFGSNASNLVPGDTNDDGDIFIVTTDAAGDPLSTRLVPTADGHWPAVSADGSTLAIAGFNDVRRIDLDDPGLAFEVIGDDADDVAISADGSTLLFDDGDGLVSWVEGTPSPMTLPVPGRVGDSLALSDDGGTFAVAWTVPLGPGPAFSGLLTGPADGSATMRLAGLTDPDLSADGSILVADRRAGGRGQVVVHGRI